MSPNSSRRAKTRCPSAVDGPHPALGVTRARGATQAFDLRKLGARHRHGEGADVFLHVFAVFGPGNGDDVFPLVEQPCQCELAGRAPLLTGERFDATHEIQVLLEVLALKAWMVLAPVAVGDVFGTLYLACEESPAERTVGDEADPELAHGGQDLVLHVAAPQRVLRLEGGDRMHRVCAPYRLGGRLGQPEKPHLPCTHQIRHRPNSLLDWHGAIDAVLIVQVDVIDAEASQRGIARGLYVFGPAVLPDELAVGSPHVA